MAKQPSQKIRKALADLTKALHRLEAPGMVIGGIASSLTESLARPSTLHGDHIDLERVRTFVHEFAQILGAPERIPEFDRLLRKVLGPTQ